MGQVVHSSFLASRHIIIPPAPTSTAQNLHLHLCAAAYHTQRTRTQLCDGQQCEPPTPQRGAGWSGRRQCRRSHRTQKTQSSRQVRRPTVKIARMAQNVEGKNDPRDPRGRGRPAPPCVELRTPSPPQPARSARGAQVAGRAAPAGAAPSVQGHRHRQGTASNATAPVATLQGGAHRNGSTRYSV